MPRRIYLCADDYGIAPGVNLAIRELIVRGRLNATSVMVAAPGFHRSDAAALDLLNVERRRVAIGLHVTLTAPFAPLSRGFAPIRDGAFLPLPAMLRRGLLRRLDRDALAAEIDAQVAAFGKAFGRPPDFFDGHHHIHLLPQAREALLAAMRRLAPQAWVRQCGGPRALRPPWADRKALFLSLLSRGMRRRARRFGIRTNPTFSGTYDYGGKADFAALFPAFLEGQREEGVVMCHPGFVDEALQRLDSLTTLRAKERLYLAGDEFPRQLSAAGVILA